MSKAVQKLDKLPSMNQVGVGEGMRVQEVGKRWKLGLECMV